MHARETVLKDDLHKMRELIDQYAADKGKLPQSLDDLISSGYMREVPKDPITDNKIGTLSPATTLIRARAARASLTCIAHPSEVSTEGTPYSEW